MKVAAKSGAVQDCDRQIIVNVSQNQFNLESYRALQSVWLTIMALVERQYAGAEAKLERELVKQCGTWQQLSLMKKKALEERENPASCEGLTPSERLLWYRRNVEEVDLDK